MAKVHNFLEMWQGSQNLHATHKESCAQNMLVTAVGYISDTKEIIKASWTNFQYNGVAAFTLSERSPLPPTLSAQDLPGGQPQVLNVGWIKSIDHHPVESDEESSPESISDTENWLNWNGDSDTPNNGEQDCEADDESNIEPGKGSKSSGSPDHWVLSAARNVLRLIWPTWRSMNNAATGFITVCAMETRRNKGNKKKQHWLCQYLFTRFYILLDGEIHLEIYYRRIVSSHMRLIVH